MDTRQVVARFEAERQALALMDHPNIAKVLDAGATETGRPFFVMELIKGLPITEYCDQSLLTVPERLQLFITVCQAVQHAHQKGIIHRDIKPSNIIFVNRVPKFADIGLVTSITPGGRSTTYVGTDGYMPPEGPGTVAADIFSLGKVLYEAYTGKDRQEFPALSGTLITSANEELFGFNEIVLRACHSDVKHRYQMVSEIRADLLKLSADAQ